MPKISWEASSIIADHDDQAQISEGRRAQFIDQAANIRDGVLHMRCQRLQQGIGGRGIMRQIFPGGRQGEREVGQHRSQPIVQIPPQASPLLLTCDHYALAGTTQIAKGCTKRRGEPFEGDRLNGEMWYNRSKSR